MRRLENDWLTNGHIDFEYKKYVLLSYFQQVKLSFGKLKLYPFLSDLVFHYNNMLDFKKNKTSIQDKFPERLTEIDIKSLELMYQRMIQDDEIMKEIQDVIEYAIPLFENNLEHGKEIYEFVERNCELSPVGLLPLYTDEGYLFIEQPKRSEARAYRYQITVFENASEKFRGINVAYIKSFSRGLGDTYENMKVALSRASRELPNPAVFLINSKLKFPQNATLMPVAKRLLVRYISST